MATLSKDWVITGCGWYDPDKCYVLEVTSPDGQQWVIPTDEATVKALQNAGLGG